jgi:hypothetical protein
VDHFALIGCPLFSFNKLLLQKEELEQKHLHLLQVLPNKIMGGGRLERKLKLKGHGNEADFLGFLQKLGPHRSLTLSFEPFRFWLQIRGDIRNRKTTPRLAEPWSR